VVGGQFDAGGREARRRAGSVRQAQSTTLLPPDERPVMK